MSLEKLQQQFSAIGDFIWHDVALKYHRSEAQTRLIIKGNQGGGTATAMMDAVLRV